MLDIKKWRDKFAFLKGRWWLIALALAGVILLIIGSDSAAPRQEREGLAVAEEYRTALEQRVTALCAHVDGVSEVQVLLTVASGEVVIYAEGADGEIVTTGGNGMITAYAVPEVTGVAVVCRGGERDNVRRELTELISAALGISSARIHISAAG